MHTRYPSLLFMTLAVALWLSATASAFAAPLGLTLDEALAAAAQNRPELKSLAADRAAAEIKARYAGSAPNPELGVEWDNLGGDLPADDGRETTLSLNQTIELGGKPAARAHKVAVESARLQQEQAITWLDIAAEVRTAYLEVQVAREHLTLQHEAEEIATALADIARERVKAGELAATEETRAVARQWEAATETQSAARSISEAELDLATLLVSPEPNGVTTIGPLPQELPIPDRQTLLANIDSVPLLSLRQSESRVAAADLSLEKANAWSDPTLSLSVREIPTHDSRAVALGISIPLPLFQRNQGAVAAADAATRKAHLQAESATLRLRTAVTKAHKTLISADQEARTLRTEVLSRSREAALAVQEGFRAGKFRYSDVLEASNALVAVKKSHLAALVELHRAAIALDHILGRPAIPATTVSPAATQHPTDANDHSGIIHTPPPNRNNEEKSHE